MHVCVGIEAADALSTEGEHASASEVTQRLGRLDRLRWRLFGLFFGTILVDFSNHPEDQEHSWVDSEDRRLDAAARRGENPGL